MTTRKSILTGMKTPAIIIGLACCLGLSLGCKKSNDASISNMADLQADYGKKKTKTKVDTRMQAPEIAPDAYGLITLSQCPMENDHVTVKVSEDLSTAEIYQDGQLLQTVKEEDGVLSTSGGEAPIHFLDANFDGLTDIFIGPGESRTYSTLLLWDSANNQYVRVGTLGSPTLQNFMLHPATKSVIQGGSNSWCNSSFTKSVWDGFQLKDVEALNWVSDADQYQEYHVHNAFTLTDEKGEETLSVASSSELPNLWQGVIKAYGLE